MTQDQGSHPASRAGSKTDSVLLAADASDASVSRPSMAPPSYSTALAMAKDELDEREADPAPLPAKAFAYNHGLQELQKQLRSYKRGSAKQLRSRLNDANDEGGTKRIIAQEIAKLVGSESHDFEELARYSSKSQ